MVTVEIRTVADGYQKYEESDQFLVRLKSLLASGYAGKELIHALISDDWSPPLLVIVIEWSENGQNFKETIPYD